LDQKHVKHTWVGISVCFVRSSGRTAQREIETLVEANPNWDGRVQNIQITDAKQWYKELRILVSSSDSSKNWDLRVDIRER